MGDLVISDPQVEVNDELLPIVANSLEVQIGLGEASVKGLSAGANQNEIQISQNVESRKSMIKFDVPTNTNSFNQIIVYKKRLNNNVVKVGGTDPATGEQIVLIQTQAIITNEPNFQFQQDGVINIEFEGNPIPL